MISRPNQRNPLVAFDQKLEYVPFISTFLSISNLFLKYVSIPRYPQREPIKKDYYTYICQKSLLRCAIIAIPIFGNLVIAIYDITTKPAPKLSRRLERSALINPLLRNPSSYTSLPPETKAAVKEAILEEFKNNYRRSLIIKFPELAKEFRTLIDESTFLTPAQKESFLPSLDPIKKLYETEGVVVRMIASPTQTSITYELFSDNTTLERPLSATYIKEGIPIDLFTSGIGFIYDPKELYIANAFKNNALTSCPHYSEGNLRQVPSTRGIPGKLNWKYDSSTGSSFTDYAAGDNTITPIAAKVVRMYEKGQRTLRHNELKIRALAPSDQPLSTAIIGIVINERTLEQMASILRIVKQERPDLPVYTYQPTIGSLTLCPTH